MEGSPFEPGSGLCDDEVGDEVGSSDRYAFWGE